MIAFDFEHVVPGTKEEAVEMHGEKSMFVSGATEFISRARHAELNPNKIIDIKAIPETTVLEEQDGKLVIGAAITLTDLVEEQAFPLLSKVCRGIANRTARNKITVGGNLMSQLPYRETLLPFLLTDSEMVIATSKGVETRSIHQIGELTQGELLLQVMTDKSWFTQPFKYERKTKQSHINYPILTACGIQKGEHWRFAFGGLLQQPFTSEKIDDYFNHNKGDELSEFPLPSETIDDSLATKEFREYLLQTVLQQMMRGGRH